MTSNWDTESIVREVLRRLTQLSATSVDVPPPVHGEPKTTAGVLHLNDRVITLALLNGKLDSVERVIVAPNAILTPAVRDELRVRNIDCRRGTRATGQQLALLLATDDAKICLRQWKQNVNACEVFPNRDAAEIAARVAQWVDRQHVAVVFSHRPQWTACRLNKHQSIRAATAVDALQVAGAIEDAGANVLVIDSRLQNNAWTSWIEQFRRGSERLEPVT